MDLKKAGSKNRVIVIQKEKRQPDLFSCWMTMALFFSPCFFHVHILDLIFSGSQTDPCFQKKNSGCRLTGRVCKKMCNHSSWAMPLSIAYHFTWLFHIVSIAIKKHKPCWISYFRCQWPFLFPHLCKELIPCHPVVTKCHLALNCFLFKDLLKDPM